MDQTASPGPIIMMINTRAVTHPLPAHPRQFPQPRSQTHHRAQVLADEVRVLAHSLGDGAEDDAGLSQLLAEGGGDGHRIKHGIDGDVGQPLLLGQGDAQLVKSGQQLWVHLFQGPLLLLLARGGVVAVGLVVNGRVVVVRPGRLLHGQPPAPRLEPARGAGWTGVRGWFWKIASCIEGAVIPCGRNRHAMSHAQSHEPSQLPT
ncbi:hypothetical protein F751_5313 [Auxenochlorella protothecoides]|uniref:Uncharacterized protein n=1 Tax=Auxenochlorella protothecoides TaxID=3075 RepID=A0A087SRP6_AUXPR|nr:hypothetical protein F751_5313 [Auxenochlorella protothecoides]KFM28400.1 hypothetical protein F751_5313 [Auxenochlorella protothecoides]